MTQASEEIKACCAAAYGSPAARILLGHSFHPGGARLTRELVRALGLGAASRAVDVASGPGTSSLLLARETGATVVGVDLSPANVAEATLAAESAELHGRVSFLCGDAEALPLEDASVDGALCECALCTFPDKRAAAAELARVLRPGGRLALSDMTADPARLPEELRTVGAWVACIADARPLEEVAALLSAAGFDVDQPVRHDEALLALLDRVESRLRVLAIAGVASTAEVEQGAALAALARDAVAASTLGYGSVTATRR